MLLDLRLTPARAARLLALAHLRVQEAAGHPFHGNQWTAGGAPSLADVQALDLAMVQEAGLKGGFDKLSQVSRLDRGGIKQHIVETLSDRLVKDHGVTPEAAPALVQSHLDQWAETSGDSNPRSVQLQKTFVAELGITDAALTHLNPAGAPMVQSADRAYARAEYDNTQAMLKRHHIDHVTVFRGMNSVTLDEGVQTVNAQPASSWTTDVNVAIDFAGHRGNTSGAVLVTRVPAHRVLSTTVTGRGALPAAEVLLLGGLTKVKVYSLGKPGVKTRVLTDLER